MTTGAAFGPPFFMRPLRPLTGQALAWQREPDDKAFSLPVSGNFSPKARGGGANEKIAEPVITRWRYDFGSSVFRPSDDDCSALVCAVDVDLPSSSGKRAIFCGICRELVE